MNPIEIWSDFQHVRKNAHKYLLRKVKVGNGTGYIMIMTDNKEFLERCERLPRFIMKIALSRLVMRPGPLTIPKTSPSKP